MKLRFVPASGCCAAFYLPMIRGGAAHTLKDVLAVIEHFI